MDTKNLRNDLQKLKNPQKAKIFSRFFKTGKGEYGEGDKFLGIMTGPIGELARKYQDLSFLDLQKLLNGQYHEERTLAVMILVGQFEKGEKEQKEKVFKFYLKNSRRINNWDLVDISAPKIIGNYFLIMDNRNYPPASANSYAVRAGASAGRGTGREILYKLAKSNNLWERRIAIMSTFAFIRNNDFSDSLKIAEILLYDKHDLIHKACGWMLREIGKRDQKKEEIFLKKHLKIMPRTMLRYAIEKFPQKKREYYLAF